MTEIKTTSTSSDSAYCEPIVLRETDKVRLVFKPLMTNNQQDKSAPINGTFLYQKKSKTEEWSDIEDSISLNTLKNGEGVKLGLKSSEILKLFQHFHDLYELYYQKGIRNGQNTYFGFQVDPNDNDIIDSFRRFHNFYSKDKDFFDYSLDLMKSDESKEILKKLNRLDIKDLNSINSLIGLSTLKNVLRIWEENKDKSDEEFWQRTLSDNSFVFSQIFSFPSIILAEKAYVGGKSIHNSNGNLVDYLISNHLTKNTALIEIKTPVTRLLGSQYRGNAFSISPELSGSIVQVQNYRNSLLQEYAELNKNGAEFFHVFNPACIVIIGNTAELDDQNKLRSFELFRESLETIKIITYDELFKKVEVLANLIEGKINTP